MKTLSTYFSLRLCQSIHLPSCLFIDRSVYPSICAPNNILCSLSFSPRFCWSIYFTPLPYRPNWLESWRVKMSKWSFLKDSFFGSLKIQNRNCVARLHSKVEHRTQENIFNEASLCDLLQKWQCKHRINSLFCNSFATCFLNHRYPSWRCQFEICLHDFFFQTRTLDDSFEVTVTTLASKLTYILHLHKSDLRS